MEYATNLAAEIEATIGRSLEQLQAETPETPLLRLLSS
jgi:hypothetical protein